MVRRCDDSTILYYSISSMLALCQCACCTNEIEHPATKYEYKRAGRMVGSVFVYHWTGPLSEINCCRARSSIYWKSLAMYNVHHFRLLFVIFVLLYQVFSSSLSCACECERMRVKEKWKIENKRANGTAKGLLLIEIWFISFSCKLAYFLCFFFFSFYASDIVKWNDKCRWGIEAGRENERLVVRGGEKVKESENKRGKETKRSKC